MSERERERERKRERESNKEKNRGKKRKRGGGTARMGEKRGQHFERQTQRELPGQRRETNQQTLGKESDLSDSRRRVSQPRRSIKGEVYVIAK